MKRFLHITIFGFSILCFNGCGWGWFVPYSWQPSYHEFKEMCKLNELPDNEEKYNKILSYFDLSLNTLDWEELNRRVEKLKDTNGWYEKGRIEYITETNWQTKGRLEIQAVFLSNKSVINKHNITKMYFAVIFHTRRYLLEQKSMQSYEWVWKEIEL